MDGSRTAQTEKFYIETASGLLRQFRVSAGMVWSEDPLAFCRWIQARVESWKPATWRVNRASLAFYFGSAGEQDLVDMVKNIGSERCARDSTNTSAQKAKALPTSDIKQILDFLEKSPGQSKILLGLWLLAGRIVGLRPSEWEYAILDGEKLIVRNAKTTNGRSHGPSRTFLLYDLPEEQKEVVALFVQELQKKLSETRSMKKVYETAKRRLHRVCRQIWPGRKKYPTLYSGRHQFSADLKRSGVPEAEIAALFGHATVRTAKMHYGRKNYGEEGYSFVQADPKNIEAVRKNEGMNYLKGRKETNCGPEDII